MVKCKDCGWLSIQDQKHVWHSADSRFREKGVSSGDFIDTPLCSEDMLESCGNGSSKATILATIGKDRECSGFIPVVNGRELKGYKEMQAVEVLRLETRQDRAEDKAEMLKYRMEDKAEREAERAASEARYKKERNRTYVAIVLAAVLTFLASYSMYRIESTAKDQASPATPTHESDADAVSP
ncbi:hypothetical protein Mal33_50400 [Rosistilla oblonga]|uniref:Uncharacterized protein n=1 Tax=Rosistilla oblonga TaxID=2527990 RepID=A0A518J132_9BACT|nr:hypothetical protein Mal33_50400 [Rosistilla oblonga]